MPRRGKRISPHFERIEHAISTIWQTSLQIAERADVTPRTARHHLGQLAKKGVIEVRESWPALKYRAKK